MKRHFKKYLVPHEENDHQPHLLHDTSTRKLIATVCAIELVILVLILPTRPGILTEKINNMAAIFPSVLVEKANKTRTSVAMNELVISDELVYAAQLKANDMAAKGYFAHNSPDGKTPWDWLDAAGYSYQTAGENLAVNFVDSTDVHNAWLNSPTHKANIVRDGFTEIGIATAEGTYKGQKAVFVAQFFGTPSRRVDTFAGSDTSQGAVAVSSLTPTTGRSTSPASTTTEVLGAEIATTLLPRDEASPDIEREVSRRNYPESNSRFFANGEISNNSLSNPPTLVTKMLSAPKTMLGLVLLVLAWLITLAIILKVCVKRHIQYPKLVANGIIVLLLILLFTILNQYVITLFAEIT